MREEPAMQPLVSCCFWLLTLEQFSKALRLQWRFQILAQLPRCRCPV